MPKLTPGQYVEKKGLRCPSCGEDSVTGHQIDIEEGGAYQECTCHNCCAMWTDHYKLVGYDELEESEPETT